MLGALPLPPPAGGTLRASALGQVLLATALYTAPCIAAAQNPPDLLRGTVVDSGGAALPEVAVGIATLRRATRTDSYGHFSLGRLPSGDFELLVRRIGYKPTAL